MTGYPHIALHFTTAHPECTREHPTFARTRQTRVTGTHICAPALLHPTFITNQTPPAVDDLRHEADEFRTRRLPSAAETAS